MDEAEDGRQAPRVLLLEPAHGFREEDVEAVEERVGRDEDGETGVDVGAERLLEGLLPEEKLVALELREVGLGESEPVQFLLERRRGGLLVLDGGRQQEQQDESHGASGGMAFDVKYTPR